MFNVEIVFDNITMTETTQSLAISAVTKGRLPVIDTDIHLTKYHFAPTDFDNQTPAGAEFIVALAGFSEIKSITNYPAFFIMGTEKLLEEVPEGLPNREKEDGTIRVWGEYKSANQEFRYNNDNTEVAIHSWSFGEYLTGAELAIVATDDTITLLSQTQYNELMATDDWRKS